MLAGCIEASAFFLIEEEGVSVEFSTRGVVIAAVGVPFVTSYLRESDSFEGGAGSVETGRISDFIISLIGETTAAGSFKDISEVFISSACFIEV